jgi:hypothetical protein
MATRSLTQSWLRAPRGTSLQHEKGPAAEEVSRREAARVLVGDPRGHSAKARECLRYRPRNWW